MLKGWTKRFCLILFLCHTELLCQKKNKRKDSNNKEQTPHFVLVQFRPQWLICCPEGLCWDSRDSPGDAELVGIMAEWGLLCQACRERKRQLGWKQNFSQRPSSSCPWKPSKSVEDDGIWGIAIAKDEGVWFKHQHPLLHCSTAGLELTWPRSRNKEGFPFSFFGMPVSCLSEYLHDHKFRALEDIFSQRLHVQDTIM